MGHKINPIGFRTGILLNWKSRWFNDKPAFRALLKEDTQVREMLVKQLKEAGLSKVIIERQPQVLSITLLTSRPGVVIGRQGSGIEDLKAKIRPFTKTQEIKIIVEEVRDPNLHAAIVAQSIADQIEKRIGFRRAMRQSIERVMQSGAQGIKISIGGRLDGAEIARTEWLAKGKIPLQTLRADIDYAQRPAHTTYGVVGVKVWIFRGERFDTDFDQTEANTAPAAPHQSRAPRGPRGRR